MIRILSGGLFILLVLMRTTLAADPQAYVLNSNAETLSKINLNTGTVSNDIVGIGSDVFSYPNQIVIRDTLMYVVTSGHDEIQVINLNNEETVTFMPTGAFTNPYWIDFLDEQYLYVTLMLTDEIAKLDYRSGAIVTQTGVGMAPEGILLLDEKAYIACTGFSFETWLYDTGKVCIYDLNGDSVMGYIAVGTNPQYLARDGLGRVHVVCTGDYGAVAGAVYIIDPAIDAVIDSINIGGTPGQITIGPDNIAYIAAAGWTMDGYVYSYQALTGEVYHDAGNPIAVDLNCMTVASFQDSTVFEGSFGTNMINVIDSDGNVLDSYAVNDGPVHIVFNFLPGDANGDFEVNLLDVTDIIGWLYTGGEPPRWPRWRANANADKQYNILDITYLIGYLYRDGPRPRPGPHWVQ